MLQFPNSKLTGQFPNIAISNCTKSLHFQSSNHFEGTFPEMKNAVYNPK